VLTTVNIDDIVYIKTNPSRHYKITAKWKNIFQDTMYTLTSVSNSDITFPEFEKYVLTDYLRVENGNE